MPLILALDQGTTSSRAIVFDEMGRKLSQVQIPLPQIFPRAGWVEQDAELMWRNQLQCARQAIAEAGANDSDIVALGVTNQRETVIVWDRATGEPLMNAIVWQDRRTSEACDALEQTGVGPMVREKTGLPIDPYFSASKIAWMLDNVEGARARAEAGELAFGTVDMLVRVAADGRGGPRRPTSTNASRTLLFDIERGVWDDELLALFGVPRALLPEVVRSSGVVGSTAPGVFDAADPGRVDHRRPAGGARGQRVLLGGRREGRRLGPASSR